MVKRMKNFALTDKIAVSPRAAARTRKLAGKGIQGIVKAVFLLVRGDAVNPYLALLGDVQCV